MSGYKIVTDATVDLTPAWAERIGVDIIPMECPVGRRALFLRSRREYQRRGVLRRDAPGQDRLHLPDKSHRL